MSTGFTRPRLHPHHYLRSWRYGLRLQRQEEFLRAKSRSLSSRERRCFITVLTVCDRYSSSLTQCTSFVPNEPSWLLPLHAYALVDEGFQFHSSFSVFYSSLSLATYPSPCLTASISYMMSVLTREPLQGGGSLPAYQVKCGGWKEIGIMPCLVCSIPLTSKS